MLSIECFLYLGVYFMWKKIDIDKWSVLFLFRYYYFVMVDLWVEIFLVVIFLFLNCMGNIESM